MKSARVPLRWIIPVAISMVLASPAVAETYDFLIWPVCEPFTTCGFDSVQQLEETVIETVEVMNLVWKPVGISFRPTVMPLNQGNADYYRTKGCSREIEYCDDLVTVCDDDDPCPGSGTCKTRSVCDDLTQECGLDIECTVNNNGECHDLDAQRRINWRRQVAEQYPNSISMMLTKYGKCCSNVANPTKPLDTMFGLWCKANDDDIFATGTLWAHEMGHHFCLRHTFTGQDLATNPPMPNHDGDVGIVSDTPGDPMRVEKSDKTLRCQMSPGTVCTEDGNECGVNGPCVGFIKQNHEYCDITVQTNVTDGSPQDSYCTPDCKRCTSGPCLDGQSGTLTPTNDAPLTHAAMSYYPGADCKGPIVVGGMVRQGFTTETGTLATSAPRIPSSPGTSIWTASETTATRTRMETAARTISTTMRTAPGS
jgi:hypothetical protein